MSQRADLWEKVEDVTADAFEGLALEVFRYQLRANPLYGRFVELLGVEPEAVDSLGKIPFLPISFFKSHWVQTGKWEPEAVFRSSGTSGMSTSRHAVRSVENYLANCRRGFRAIYKKEPSEFCWLALLPSYLERKDSSLVCMAEHFIRFSRYKESGFFLNEWEDLRKRLEACAEKEVPVALLGVSFALLELAERFPGALPLRSTIVMETGGMKGRRREMIRSELHEILTAALGVEHIHSEYGMTELLSQGYSRGKGIFQPAPTMRVLAREINDPLCLQQWGKTGVLNVIDLANLHSCAFIATDDLGKVYQDHTFEVLGRLDGSDIRGCNLLIEEG